MKHEITITISADVGHNAESFEAFAISREGEDVSHIVTYLEEEGPGTMERLFGVLYHDEA